MYYIIGIRARFYTIKCEVDGFEEDLNEEIEIRVGLSKKLDITMFPVEEDAEAEVEIKNELEIEKDETTSLEDSKNSKI